MKISPKNWSLSELSEDYGIDYFVQVFDKDTDEATNISFIIQLKGTEKYKKHGNHVKFQIRTDYLKYYYNKVDKPVFLVVVDVINEEYCCLFIQKYINEELNIKRSNWKSQETVTVDIPIKNTFSNPKIIEQVAEKGSTYCNLLIYGIPTQELMWKVKNITNDPIKKSEDLKNKYSEIYSAQTRVGFEFIQNQNDSINAKKSFQSIYNKTKDDKDNIIHHLNSIAALISFCNLENKKQLFHFINEGLELSIENNITYFEYYFNCLKLESQSLILQNELQKNLLIQKISENNNSSNKIKEYLKKKIYIENNQLYTFYGNFILYLIKIMDNKELYMFLELMRMLLGVLINHVYITYNFTTKDVLNLMLYRIEQLIAIFSKIIDVSTDFSHYKYEFYKYKILYHYLKQDCYPTKLLEEYEELAKQYNVKYHINLIKSLKEQISMPVPNKDFSDITYNDLLELYEKLLLIEGIDLKNNNDETINLKQAIKDLNPKRILDNCIHLELYYVPNEIPSKLRLYSEGLKILYCKYGKIKSNCNLDKAFASFNNEFCSNCKYKTTQDIEWNLEKKSYVKSNEFKKILKDKYYYDYQKGEY